MTEVMEKEIIESQEEDVVESQKEEELPVVLGTTDLIYGLPASEIEAVRESYPPVQELFELAQSMMKLVLKEKALGLSAIQIGIPLKIAVVRIFQGGKGVIVPVINPVVVAKGSRVKSVEGCLSDPTRLYVLKRYKAIKARFLAFDREGTMIRPAEINLKGLDAFVFQHETDHCNGIHCFNKGKFYRDVEFEE